ncbi:alpha/beta fold hydrolase [Puerhibacterium sp. TATVAM-FAB25]|uniref:adenylate/guanylate cyclase domain-containing protein n=1 Tax=Puerhibacterium sp. TATVAM-FAB25 TaxID=3093699 RepID=UPI00397B9D8E
MYLAYQVVGAGERAIVLAAGGPTHAEGMWDVPQLARFVEQLSRFGRVVLFDKRGVGLSDRVTETVTVEQAADDILRIMDAVAVDTAVLFGMLEGASACLVAAARHPERVHAVVAFATAPTFVPGQSGSISLEVAEALRGGLREKWGSGVSMTLASDARARDPATVAAWQRLERMSGTPTTVARWLDYWLSIDVRPYLPEVHAPVLVVHTGDTFFADLQAARSLCEQLPHARLIELTDRYNDNLVSGGAFLDEVEDFIAGTRLSASRDRHMVALLVTDLVGSTQTMARMGDTAWREYLGEHRRSVREALQRYEGTEIDTAGDGFLATFRLASSALRCAIDIRDDALAAGVAVRQGIHAGEVTVLGSGIAGQAVHAAARIAGLAGAGEILASESAYQLAEPGSLSSEPTGARVLRGLPDRMRIRRITGLRHPQPSASVPPADPPPPLAPS